MSTAAWTPQRAAEYLGERGMFGMQPGLERITALLDELNNPHETFRTIHIVGTNGKSSTARFSAHLLAERGLLAGAYVSPHLIGFEERVLLPHGSGVRQATPEEFALAVGEVAEAAAKVELGFADGEIVTQFELVTAAAFVLLERHGAIAAAIEAGLGGRHDATNVFEDCVVGLNSVGLDHTQWLGETIEQIAAEKLAVVEEGDQLVVASGQQPELATLIGEAAARSGQQLIEAPDRPIADGLEMVSAGDFQLKNLALAEACVAALLGSHSADAVRRVAANVTVPGRLFKIADEPETWLDAAHNPAGVEALMPEIERISAGRRVVAVVGLLADKNAQAMVAAMLSHVDTLIATSPENPRALAAAHLGEVAVACGHQDVRVVEDPRAALQAAKHAAAPDAVVIATGSVHLVGDLLSEPGQRTVTAL